MSAITEPTASLTGNGVPDAPEGWPVLGAAAMHGLAGKVVRAIEPVSEADPIALLLDFLVSFGSSLNSGPHAIADGSVHPARLNVVLVGDTARARKGTARANVNRVMEIADPGWAENRVMSGLASGEGLIAAVRDGDGDDEGQRDKRLLVHESEFARVLTVAGRDGNTLSAVVRDAWDSGRLRVLTRKDPLVATGAHISVLAHITREELIKRLSDTEAANGFANRFLFALVRRSKLLPSGNGLDDAELQRIGRLVRNAIGEARKVNRVVRSETAEKAWAVLYQELANDDVGGLVGSITARAEAQCLRLSVVYALLDGRGVIEEEHIAAAAALWGFCKESASFIFGDALGDDVADRLLAGLHDAKGSGLSTVQQRDLFSRHVSGDRLAHAREVLTDRDLIMTVRVRTAGRPADITYAIAYAPTVSL